MMNKPVADITYGVKLEYLVVEKDKIVLVNSLNLKQHFFNS
jgi:hypothetical protein